MKNLFLSPNPLLNNGILVMRVFTGVFLAKFGLVIFNSQDMIGMSDYIKSLGFPAPLLFAYLAKGSEFFGGIFLILGLFNRISCVFIAITMAVASFMAHKGDLFNEAQSSFLYLLIVIYLIFTGPGKWSLDYIVFKSK
jgi:putative oxidoreductase